MKQFLKNLCCVWIKPITDLWNDIKKHTSTDVISKEGLKLLSTKEGREIAQQMVEERNSKIK